MPRHPSDPYANELADGLHIYLLEHRENIGVRPAAIPDVIARIIALGAVRRDRQGNLRSMIGGSMRDVIASVRQQVPMYFDSDGDGDEPVLVSNDPGAPKSPSAAAVAEMTATERLAFSNQGTMPEPRYAQLPGQRPMPATPKPNLRDTAAARLARANADKARS